MISGFSNDKVNVNIRYVNMPTAMTDRFEISHDTVNVFKIRFNNVFKNEKIMYGTIANFYGVPGWLEYLQAEDTTPYEIAAPLVNFSLLARYLHKLQACGVAVGIVSWTSKSGSEDFHKQVVDAKMEYLRRHLPSVEWDEIYIVPYGTPKYEVVKNPDGVLFDDESRNRIDWRGVAFSEDNLIEILKALLKAREV